VTPEEKIKDAAQRALAEQGQGGLDSSRRREAAIGDGLEGIAALHGREFQAVRYIDSRGEVSLALKQEKHWARSDADNPTYGVGLAADLSRVLTRTGIVANPGIGRAKHCNWCFVNHFEAERLILTLAAEVNTPVRDGINAVHAALEATGGYISVVGGSWQPTADSGRKAAVVPNGTVNCEAAMNVQISALGGIEIEGVVIRQAELEDALANCGVPSAQEVPSEVCEPADARKAGPQF